MTICGRYFITVERSSVYHFNLYVHLWIYKPNSPLILRKSYRMRQTTVIDIFEYIKFLQWPNQSDVLVIERHQNAYVSDVVSLTVIYLPSLKRCPVCRVDPANCIQHDVVINVFVPSNCTLYYEIPNCIIMADNNQFDVIRFQHSSAKVCLF